MEHGINKFIGIKCKQNICNVNNLDSTLNKMNTLNKSQSHYIFCSYMYDTLSDDSASRTCKSSKVSIVEFGILRWFL